MVGGVIGLTLTACTTDSVYDDVDQQTQQDGSQYQTNSFDDSQRLYLYSLYLNYKL